MVWINTNKYFKINLDLLIQNKDFFYFQCSLEIHFLRSLLLFICKIFTSVIFQESNLFYDIYFLFHSYTFYTEITKENTQGDLLLHHNVLLGWWGAQKTYAT